MPKIPVEKKLRFIFTKDSFQLDIGNYAPSLSTQKKLYEDDPELALYNIAYQEKPDYFDQSGLFLYETAELFINHITSSPDYELQRENLIIQPNEFDYSKLVIFIPFALGAENIDQDWISIQFQKLNQIYAREVKSFKGTVKQYLQEKSQSIRIPEKIFFHLVENNRENKDQYPFAFLATYSTRDEKNKIRHMPLQYALTEFKADRKQLLELLSCLSKAAAVSDLINDFMEKGELFHPLQLTSEEAYSFLRDVYAIEESGIVCRIPNWWKKKSYSPKVTMKVGEKQKSLLGLDSLLSITPSIEVDGVTLTREDIQKLLTMSEGLTLIKGKWVEIDHDRLQKLLAILDTPQAMISLKDALNPEQKEEDEYTITNGTWLSTLFNQLSHPHLLEDLPVPENFQATLRPYQLDGYKWLNTMHTIQLGACLADDMGLGKTIQVLAYLDELYHHDPDCLVLLIVPASLLGNWFSETHKFAPDLPITLLHGLTPAKVKKTIQEGLSFITLTTYGMASKSEELTQIHFDTIIIDEAQAIKNPGTKQTKAIKALQGTYRIALTGTPIENDLSNLWSLFDFLNQGLLGSSSEFKKFAGTLESHPEGYVKLRKMISPFMIRRLKTDQNIISDLPDKIERIEYVSLTRKQSLLYNEYLDKMITTLEESEGIQRKGLVLASIAKLKQICNHPSLYLGDESYEPKDSGKFEILKELCETIYEKRERVLIFTQYKEIIPALDDYLTSIFTIRGLTLDGDTPIKKRNEYVKMFQSDQYIPYMILSLKAGGTGLTLTKASHVIHFDRWWNPAVENQATDRAFRIGQKNNVIVHKFVCQGTLEEKIDQLITSKQELAQNIIGSSSEGWITEMSNAELMHLLKLEG